MWGDGPDVGGEAMEDAGKEAGVMAVEGKGVEVTVEEAMEAEAMAAAELGKVETVAEERAEGVTAEERAEGVTAALGIFSSREKKKVSEREIYMTSLT